VSVLSGLFAPIKEGPEKLSSYESGIEPMGSAWLQFRIHYYMFALVFVVFDVETVFLYPWAMSFDAAWLINGFRRHALSKRTPSDHHEGYLKIKHLGCLFLYIIY
jgi:NADH:ubiquinone oxidoreductase subunit 3 (subunit A)